ncbi:MAG: sensor histidine kinase [Betaproteobacteria bacterium]|jgi:signal transduction histidine kinase|nr:sensor histidine kinase [Betaproteobacteria bacterium]NBY17726.1 sensor histidine kinase [Betaproteobacteria bacterium]
MISWTQRFAPVTQGFHAYARWLVGISWKKFFLLALLLMICASILQSLPPFAWFASEHVTLKQVVDVKRHPQPAAMLTTTLVANSAEETLPTPEPKDPQIHIEIQRDNQPRVEINVPASGDATEIFETVIREIHKNMVEKKGQAHPDDEDDDNTMGSGPRVHVHTGSGKFLTDLAFLWIVASIIIKITYTGRLRAEAQASVATETAETEQLRRQVAEAQMAAMHAQLEPHFLFNTLASIDHLIQTDPPRASRMQQSLIALLRATMPNLREGKAQLRRTLGEELAVIHPYLDILKTRMEERLQTNLQVPPGLLSAEFPPMMLQSLVENAIKHGLEPKPQGGEITIEALVADGRLLVNVCDTGVGFGASPPTAANPTIAPLGSGLENIRERLKHLYGTEATLTIARNEPEGTAVRISLPYRVVSA